MRALVCVRVLERILYALEVYVYVCVRLSAFGRVCLRVCVRAPVRSCASKYLSTGHVQVITKQ